ncbi:hypothetical protein ACFL5L_04450 [candidate division KSB1 bacterium]
MNPESIPLTDLELGVIEELRTNYVEISDGLLKSIKELFRKTRILLTKVANSSDNEIRESQLALFGILNRTNELLQGGIQQVTYSNKHVWGACFRGLIETFAAIAWVSEKPSRLPALVQGDGVKLGKLLNVVYKRLQGLQKDYARLSSFAHPQSTSLLLSMTPVSEAPRVAIIAVPAPSLSTNEAQEAIENLIGICVLIHKEIQALIESHPEVINSGKIVAEKKWKGQPPDDIC